MRVEFSDRTGLNLPSAVLQRAASEIASRFSDEQRRDGRRRNPLSMFTRESFTQPRSRNEALTSARAALRDDVVLSSLRAMESLALENVSWESPNADVARLWNREAETGLLDGFFRDAFWELSTTGVATCATWWGRTQYRPKGKGPNGSRARRPIEQIVPQRLVSLPTEKVFRLESFWGNDRLLWVCEDDEEYERMVQGEDQTLRRLVAGPFTGSRHDEHEMSEAEIDPDLCLLLSSDSVWQVRLAGQDYGRCSLTPMTPVFPWLEQKARLMDADRATLVGAANFFLIFKIGTDAIPASDTEVDALQVGMTKIAKMPFIVGDHRLSVEILTPDTQATLNRDKHDVINHRIAATVMGLPDDAMLPGSGRLDPEVSARMMTAVLKQRRGILATGARLNLARKATEMNGTDLEETPAISFTPRAIPLVGVAQAMNSALAARSRRDLSRRSYLETLDYDHSVELERVREEQESGADEVFKTSEPYSSPNTNGGMPPGAHGPTGGRPEGNKTSKDEAKPKGQRG